MPLTLLPHEYGEQGSSDYNNNKKYAEAPLSCDGRNSHTKIYQTGLSNTARGCMNLADTMLAPTGEAAAFNECGPSSMSIDQCLDTYNDQLVGIALDRIFNQDSAYLISDDPKSMLMTFKFTNGAAYTSLKEFGKYSRAAALNSGIQNELASITQDVSQGLTAGSRGSCGYAQSAINHNNRADCRNRETCPSCVTPRGFMGIKTNRGLALYRGDSTGIVATGLVATQDAFNNTLTIKGLEPLIGEGVIRVFSADRDESLSIDNGTIIISNISNYSRVEVWNKHNQKLIFIIYPS